MPGKKSEPTFLDNRVSLKFLIICVVSVVTAIGGPAGTLVWNTYADDRERLKEASANSTAAFSRSTQNAEEIDQLVSAVTAIAEAQVQSNQAQAVATQAIQRNSEDVQRLMQIIREDSIRTTQQFQEILDRLPEDD